LDARGGTTLDPNRLKPIGDDEERYEQRHTSVAEGMELNFSLLDETNRARFAELGVFPEDVDVPIGMAARLWAETGGLDRHDTEGLLAACDERLTAARPRLRAGNLPLPRFRARVSAGPCRQGESGG
jgi:hypothetical protein